MVNPDSIDTPESIDTEEEPLDPAVARVQARLQRLMLIAGLTLGVGILAVFLAVIYRITTSNDKPPDVSIPAVIAVVQETIPDDARLIASTVAGDRIVLTYDHNAGTIVITLDPETLKIVGRLDLKPE
jgi:hypothetical protein